MLNDNVYQLVDVIEQKNILGEGVFWDHQTSTIWWTDIQSSRLFKYHPQSKHLARFETPERVGCFSLVENSEKLLIAFATGIAFYNVSNCQVAWLSRPEHNVENHRFNDGGVDSQGFFWAGTMIEGDDTNFSGALYRLNAQGHCEKKLSDINISNGLCWSNDGRVLYHADSTRHQISRYLIGGNTSQLQHDGVFATTNENAYPDGACVDSRGYLWSAHWGVGQVVCYDLEGQIIQVLTLPVSQPSCVAIGGPNMDWLIVTSAREGLSAESLKQEPLAGSLFIYQLTQSIGVIRQRAHYDDLVSLYNDQ